PEVAEQLEDQPEPTPPAVDQGVDAPLSATQLYGRSTPDEVLAPAPEPVPPMADIEEPAPLTRENTPVSPAAGRSLPPVLAIANQKGGVGKTTTAVNLGAALAELGYRVLVVDLDPQGNATTGLGINPRNLETSVYDVVMHDAPLEDCIEA